MSNLQRRIQGDNAQTAYDTRIVGYLLRPQDNAGGEKIDIVHDLLHFVGCQIQPVALAPSSRSEVIRSTWES